MPGFLLEVLQQIENLRLDRDVQRGGRFIGDEQFWLGDERHRDHNALAHAAGEFVWVTANPMGCVRHADLLQRAYAAPDGVAPVDSFVNHQRLDQLVFNSRIWIQRRHRALENHRDALAADPVQLLGRAFQQIDLAVEDGGAALDSSRRL